MKIRKVLAGWGMRKVEKIFVTAMIAVTITIILTPEFGFASPDSLPSAKSIIATPSSPAFADDNLVLNLMFNENGGTTAQSASKYMNTGTLYNGSTWVSGDNAIFGSALKFDGVNDYVNVPYSSSLAITGAITVEFWAKTNSVATWQAPISKTYDDYGTDWAVFIPASNYFQAYFLIDGVNKTAYSPAIAAGTWYHVVAVYDGAELAVYLNGVKGTPTSATGALSATADRGVFVGRRSIVYPNWFNGTIDEVRIYNRALTADEIEQHYILGSTKRIMGATPQFNWSYYSADNNKENAFQIQVGTTENGNNMWDYTNPATENRWVTCAGSALTRGVTYHARVRVQDNTGAWSENWAGTTFILNQLPIAENQKAEGQVNPENVNTLAPTLSWDYTDLDGDTQSKRQIQVGTSENDNSMWDSTVSTSSTSATYAGASLSGGVTYHWRVRVYDGYEWSSWLYGGTFRLSQLPTAPTTTTAPPTTTTTTPTTTTTAPPTTPPTTPPAEAPWAWVGVGIAIGVTIAVIVEVLRLKGKKLPKPMGLRLKGKKLPKPKFIEEIIPFILIIICVAAAKFIASEAVVFAVFLISLAIYAWRRYNSRIFVGSAIFLLVVCAVLLASGSESYANEVAILTYYFLVVGVLGLFIEYLREKKHENED